MYIYIYYIIYSYIYIHIYIYIHTGYTSPGDSETLVPYSISNFRSREMYCDLFGKI